MRRQYFDVVGRYAKDSYFLKRRAAFHFELSEYQEALADLATAVELTPDDTSNLTWIPPADIAACPDETFRVGLMALADKTVARLPDRPDGFFARARLHRALCQFDAARRDVEAAKATLDLSENHRPEFATSLNDLAWGLVTNPRHEGNEFAFAVELASKAVEISPNARPIWNTLGVAHYRNGNWAGALAALHKSMELGNTNESYDSFFIAMAHWQLGHNDEARTWFARAVDWMETNQPENDELRSFRAEAERLLGIVEQREEQGDAQPHLPNGMP